MSVLLDYLREHLGYEIMGFAVWRLALSFVLLVAAILTRKIVAVIIDVVARRVIARTHYKLDTLIAESFGRPVSWAAMLVVLYFAILPLGLPRSRESIVHDVFAGVAAVLVMAAVLRFIDGFVEYLKPKLGKTDTMLDRAIIPASRTALKILVVIVTFVWVLNNFGYPVTSIVAGLGIGGLAVALAAQGTLANWFGAFMIFTDRPFAAGDHVEVGEWNGFVEQVGLRSTRIRTLDGTVVTIPNSTVASGQINNWSRVIARRRDTTVGITYDTSPEKLREALEIAKDILTTTEGIRQDFHVRFQEFADSSLTIRMIYWTLTTDRFEYLEIIERVNLALFDRYNAAGISFAFPTRTVYLRQEAS